MKQALCSAGLVLAFVWAAAALGAEPMAAKKAKDAVGSVVAIKGKVMALDGQGASRALKIKSPIYKDDTIQTGKRGRVQLMFPDGTMISLSRKSSMKIAEYEYAPKQGKAKMTTEVTEGVFRVKGGKITKIAPDNFKTKTPTATIGIRGSFYGGALIGVSKWLKVAFLGGKGITVTNDKGMVVITTPQFGTIVVPGKPPEEPTPFSGADLAGLDPNAPPPPGDDTGPGDDGTPPPDDGTAPPDDGTAPPPDGTAPPPDGTAGGDNVTGDFAGDFTAGDTGDGMAGDLGGDILGDFGTGNLGLNNPTDVVGDIVSTGLQADLGDNVDDEANNNFVISGYYLNALMDAAFYYGLVNGNKEGGHYWGNAQVNGGAIPYNFENLPVNGTGSYTGFQQLDIIPGRIVPLPNGTTVFNDWTQLRFDNLGEFLVWHSHYEQASPEQEFEEIGFAGRPTLTSQMPNEGVRLYHGPGMTAINDTSVGMIENEGGNSAVWVNQFNKTVVGLGDDLLDTGSGNNDYTNEVLFYGKVSGSQVADIKFIALGERELDNTEVALEGGTEFGQFYGRVAQGLGLAASGTIYNAETGSGLGTFKANTGVHYDIQDPMGTIPVAPKGGAAWTGLVAGMADRLDASGAEVFGNNLSENFSLSLARDGGTVSGSLSAHDIENTLFKLNNVAVGGAEGSAYAHDQAFLAELGGPSGVVDYNGTPGTLRPVGNVLWTAHPAHQFNADTTWGYWSAAYIRPGSGYSYRVCEREGFWIAGQQTPAAEVSSLLSAGSLVGHYYGGAVCTEYDGSNFETHKGSSHMVINFTSSAQTISVAGYTSVNARGFVGNANFTGSGGPDIAFKSGSDKVTSAGFTDSTTGSLAAKNGGNPLDGEAHGRFYGPNARSVGANFLFYDGSTNKKYAGVIGAQR